MNITIQHKTENSLLNRVEVKGRVTFEGVTPSNAQVTEAVAKAMKAEPTLVVMKHIYTRFGHQDADIEAVVYATPEAKQRTEVVPPHLKKKTEEATKAPPAKGGKK